MINLEVTVNIALSGDEFGFNLFKNISSPAIRSFSVKLTSSRELPEFPEIFKF